MMSTMDDRWQKVGVALRRARGTIDMTEAARRSGNSRQWWLEAEKGVRPPRPEKLAAAVIGVGGDVAEIFALAGYDPAPFVDKPSELTQPADALLDQLAGMRADIRSLVEAVAQLAERLADPPAPARSPSVKQGRPASRQSAGSPR
jgi:transcriptional regulator with XRE-family HTH domain